MRPVLEHQAAQGMAIQICGQGRGGGATATCACGGVFGRGIQEHAEREDTSRRLSQKA